MFTSLALLAVIYTMTMVVISRTIQIRRTLEKKSKYHCRIDLAKGKICFSKIMYMLTTSYKYNLNIIKDNKYVISENCSFTSWGYYYLIENNNDIVDIYLVPKYIFDYSINNDFNYRLFRVKAHIELLNKINC